MMALNFNLGKHQLEEHGMHRLILGISMDVSDLHEVMLSATFFPCSLSEAMSEPPVHRVYVANAAYAATKWTLRNVLNARGVPIPSDVQLCKKDQDHIPDHQTVFLTFASVFCMHISGNVFTLGSKYLVLS